MASMLEAIDVMNFNTAATKCIQQLRDAGVGEAVKPLVAGIVSKCGVNDPVPTSPRPPATFGSNGSQMRELTKQAYVLIDEGWRLAGLGYSPEVADNLNELRRRMNLCRQ